MKQILASLLVIAVLALPPATSDSTPPSPEAVTTVQGATTVDVYWVPPAMSPLDLGVTTYEVYGLDAQGEHWLMDVPALEFSASVQAGYANYGVRAIFHGTASDLARACVAVTLIPPNIENHC